MQRWLAKFVCGLIMFVAMPICFLLPVRMVSVFRRWGARGQLIIDLLSCFAGGVFLATYLVFMAPAVRVLIETNLMKPHGITYPLPDALIGVGFFMMLTINYVVRTVNDCSTSPSTTRRRSAAASSRHRRSSSGRSRMDSARSEVFYEDAIRCVQVITDASSVDKVSPDDVVVCNETSTNGNGIVSVNGNPLRSSSMARQFSLQSTLSDALGTDAFHRPPGVRSSVSAVHRGPGISASLRASIAELASMDGDDWAHAGGEEGKTSVTRSVVMMLALSVDSVLEGMTIGLKQTVIEVWAIFIGILVHEAVIAFCLGLQLVRVNAGRLGPVVAACTVYTLMNPIGVAIATAVFETADASEAIDLANGVLQAVTSGCFIYVVFYEILDGQITDNTPLSRIAAVFFGFVFLAAFAAIPGSGAYDHQRTHLCRDDVIINATAAAAADDDAVTFTNLAR